jgi:hypothetical protein
LSAGGIDEKVYSYSIKGMQITGKISFYNPRNNVIEMRHMRLMFLTLILMCYLLPVGLAHADETWIEGFALESEIIPGENVTVSITVGYEFNSEVQLNPGIFSFYEDEWIVDAFYPIVGSGVENYTLEFPLPDSDGDYVYQANVWYIKNDRWFFDGIQAAHNFSIHIGAVNETVIEEYANILEHSAPNTVNASTYIEVFVLTDFSFVNETEVSINIRNMGNMIVSEEFDFLLDQGERNYTLTMMVPDEAGDYSYDLSIEKVEINLTLLASRSFLVEVLALPEPDEPDDPDEPDTPPDVNQPDSNETDTNGPDIDEPEEPQYRNYSLLLLVVGVLVAAAGYQYMKDKI